MPELPPLHVKVEFDTKDLDKGKVETVAFAEEVKKRLETAGQAYVTFGDKGEIATLRISSASAKTQADLDRLAERARAFAGTMDSELAKGSKAMIKLAEDGTTSLGNVEKTFTNTAAAITNTVAATSSNLLGMGPPMLALVVVVAALAAQLSLVLLPLAAFTIGLAGALTVLSLGLGALGLLGVGIVALAEHAGNWAEAAKNLTTAQTALTNATNAHDAAVRRLQEGEAALIGVRKPSEAQLLHLQDLQNQVALTTQQLATAQGNLKTATEAAANPLTTLEQHLNQVAITLGQQATPAASALLGWLDSLVPVVGRLGSELITWFGDRIGPAIRLVNTLFQDFAIWLEHDLGPRLGHWLDDFLANAPQNEAFFKEFLKKLGDALLGLLDNLSRLAKWFLDNWPRMQAVVSETTHVMGIAVQGLAAAFGFLADHANQIDQALIILHGFVTTKLNPALAELAKHHELVQAAMIVLTGAAIILGGALVGPWIAFTALVVLWVGAIAVILAVRDAIVTLADNLKQRLVDGITFAGTHLTFLKGWFDAITGAVDALMNRLGALLGMLDRVRGAGAAASEAVTSAAGGGWGGGPPAHPNFVNIGAATSELLGAVSGVGAGFAAASAGAGVAIGGGQGMVNHFHISGSGLNEEQVAMAIRRHLTRVMSR